MRATKLYPIILIVSLIPYSCDTGYKENFKIKNVEQIVDNTPESQKYLREISSLIKGRYDGFSFSKMKTIGLKPPQAKGIIDFEGIKLSKQYVHYEPLMAETGFGYGYRPPIVTIENGIIQSQNIIWSSRNNRLVLVTDWLENSHNVKETLNLFPIIKGDNAGKLYAILYSEYSQVWGFKDVDKQTVDRIVELFKKYYKEINDNNEPWQRKRSIVNKLLLNKKYKILNTFFRLEIENDNGKIYYEKGKGYTDLIFIEKTNESKIIWYEFSNGIKTATLIFNSDEYKMGTFIRDKDKKKFLFKEFLF